MPRLPCLAEFCTQAAEFCTQVAEIRTQVIEFCVQVVEFCARAVEMPIPRRESVGRTAAWPRI
ncbi:hypothetical protein ABZ639_21110 [Saccharomonospora sp. NPDC006951]